MVANLLSVSSPFDRNNEYYYNELMSAIYGNAKAITFMTERLQQNIYHDSKSAAFSILFLVILHNKICGRRRPFFKYISKGIWSMFLWRPGMFQIV